MVTQTVCRKAVNSLLNSLSIEEIEGSLVRIFLKENSVPQSDANDFLSGILDVNGDTELVECSLKQNKIQLTLENLEKIFEVLVPEEDRDINGVFFTPNDVVKYIVNRTVTADEKICDPACGSGAFLVEAAKRLHTLTQKPYAEIISNNLWGGDLLEYNIKRTKILLTLLCLINKEIKDSIRFNLACTDTLSFDWGTQYSVIAAEGGFDCVLSNPPYAKYKPSTDFRLLDYITAPTKGEEGRANTYPLFIEQMMKLSKKGHSHSSLVVPLSIAYNTSATFLRLRKLISKSPNTWYFNFYDRSPDSIFGDDVKTRVCILFYNDDGRRVNRLFTSSLKRWNSTNRKELFKKDSYIELINWNVELGIPKISDEIELDTLKRVLPFKGNIKNKILKSSPKSQFKDMLDTKLDNAIFYYSSAYNWLPVFRDVPPSFEGDCAHIPTSLNAFKCANVVDTDALFACLNSKLSYWLWVVYGDGFHLTRNFIESLPYGDNIDPVLTDLAILGRELRARESSYLFHTSNAGKSIGNYNVLNCLDILKRIDEVLIDTFDINSDFQDYLGRKYFEHISAGREKFKNVDVLCSKEL